MPIWMSWAIFNSLCNRSLLAVVVCKSLICCFRERCMYSNEFLSCSSSSSEWMVGKGVSRLPLAIEMTDSVNCLRGLTI